MVVGVWELVLFLWSHPVISFMFLLLFSPPFYPVIVYFSPLLICTGLVAVAMISMNMGRRAEESEGLQNATRGRLHEPAAHHNVEFTLKPARESWLEWVKKKEEKAKAWVDSRFLTQDKWQFRNIPGVAPEEEESMAVNSDNHEGNQVPSYRELLHATPIRPAEVRLAPIITRRDISPPQGNYEVFAPVAEARKVSNDRSYSSVPEAEDRKPIPLVQVPVEERPFTFSSLEHRSVPSLVVPVAAAEAESLPVSNVQTVASVVIPSAPKAESKDEEAPISDFKSQPHSEDERVTEDQLVLLQEEVLPPIDIESCLSKGPRENGDFLVKMPEKIVENLRLITSEELNAVISDSDQVTKVETPLEVASCDPGIPVSLELVQSDVDETRNYQTSSELHGNMLRSMEVLVSPELSVLGEDRRASPEAETSVFSQLNQSDIVQLAAPERFSAGEKIIFVDEPSKFTTVQTRSIPAEAIETLSIQKSIGQIVVLGTEPRKSDFESQKDRSPEDGLDDNIESCGNVPPIPTSTASAVLLQNSEPMAVVRSSVSEGSITESNALVQVIPQPGDLEWMMSSIYNDVALTTSRRVLDKSYSLNSTFTGGEEYDDLTARFYALKKSMSFDTTRRWEEPISLRTADVTNSIVPVYVPDTVTRVEKDPFSQGLDVQEKKSRPRLSDENVESVESITARLLTKFTPNVASKKIFSQPPSRPAPALPTIAPASVESEKSLSPPKLVESDKSVVVPPASVQSDKGGETAEHLVHPTDLTAAKIISHSKKSLTSFLSRRRERMISLPSMEALSNSGEGEGVKGLKVSSGRANTGTSVEDRDEESTTTTSGRQRKQKMISPLKRVFSMDANAGSGRKVDSWRVSSVKLSPVREKQSVIDRSKDKFMKLFSSEGGMTKLELAEVGKQAIPATPESATSSEGHRADNVEADSKIGVSLAETGEEMISQSEPLPSSVKLSPVREKQSVIDRSKDKFMKLFSSEGGMTKLELAEVGKQAIPSTPESATSSEGHRADNVEADSKIGGVSLAETGEEMISQSEPLPSSGPSEETIRLPTLDTGEPDGLAKVRGNKVTKSSSGKKFSWSWTKKDDKSLPATPESAPSAECHGIEDVGVDSEKQLLRDIEAVSFADAGEVISKAEALLRPAAPSEKAIPPSTVDAGEPEGLANVGVDRVNRSSSEKKFAFSWTKKKRSSHPQDAPVDQLMSPDRCVSCSRKGTDEESRVILMSPLTRFHSSSAIMSPVNENTHTGDPWDENHSSEFRFLRPDSKADSRKGDSSPYKRSPISWWSPKTDLPTADKKGKVEKVEKVEKIEKAAPPPKVKKISTSWWSRRHIRADSKAVSSSSPDLPPTDIKSTTNVTDSAVSPSSTARDDYFAENTNRMRDDSLQDDDEVAGVAPRPWHRRERSESLPSRAKFSRFHTRQTSLSGFTFPRTPELSPASSSGRATDNNNSSIGTSSTSVSLPRTDEDSHYELVKEKRNNDPFDSISGTKNSNVGWRTNSAILPIRPYSVRTLDLANEQLRGSPFQRSHLDVNSRLYRNSPSGAEIRITDKLKVPLEEVLSLLSTGDTDEQHPLTTADDKTTGSTAGGDHRRASSSSSEEETEEEWSATSEDEDESQLQQPQQFAPPTAARIRRRLPHYIFSRGEPTAN